MDVSAHHSVSHSVDLTRLSPSELSQLKQIYNKSRQEKNITPKMEKEALSN